jgi:hypothetical protein
LHAERIGSVEVEAVDVFLGLLPMCPDSGLSVLRWLGVPKNRAEEFTRVARLSIGEDGSTEDVRRRTTERDPLTAVLACGDAVNTADVLVELIAVEVRSATSTALVRAWPRRPWVIQRADVSVADNLDTPYEAIVASGHGTSGRWLGEVMIEPSLNVLASHLMVSIRSFHAVDDGRRTRIFDGPWDFRMPNSWT